MLLKELYLGSFWKYLKVKEWKK